MIIDHIGMVVADFAKSKIFYSQCLAPLGVELVMEVECWAGFGRAGKPEFWFGAGGRPHSQLHIAFTAESRYEVDRFYQAALDAGAKDNGAPGIRSIYHPNYYGAFVYDLDGNNIEAVCHRPD